MPKVGKAAAAGAPAAPKPKTEAQAPVASPQVPPVLMPFAINHAPLPAALPRPARVAANAQYFDALISLIPSAVFASVAAAEEEDAKDLAAINRKYFKHAKAPKEGKLAAAEEKNAAKEERNSKQVRFGSEAVSQSLIGKRPREPEAGAGSEGGSGEEAEAEITYATSSHGSGPASSIEELRKRLHAKIAQLRSARKGGDDDDDDDDDNKAPKPSKPAAAAAAQPAAKKPKLQQAQSSSQQQRPGQGKDAAATANKKEQHGAPKPVQAQAGVKRPAPSGSANGKPAEGAGNPNKRAKLEGGAAAPGVGSTTAPSTSGDLDFAFGAIAGGAGAVPSAAAPAAAGAPAPGSKKQKLHKLLKKASKREARLARLATKGEEGAAAAAAAKLTTSYDAALRKASGEKVLDDAALLAKSLKRMKKAKAKSAEAWSERVKAVKDSQKERQVTRAENIKKKKHRGVNQLAEKKAADREREREGSSGGGSGSGSSSGGGAGGPPARPGFEGRKKKFLNK